ncbi:hypothetical protein K9B32_26100 [Rhizobium sp. 3T7]|uniref:hypothetical protein n=1 Tax=Rhizobium sp. 3T7 TaxID=2874922 RepID=UPI001CCCAA75|nr:hypothetical protein [Rhizobium sp. 3T7]MBZ9793536.1 hypothetical protein [Rhizobium sp. 3T7]
MASHLRRALEMDVLSSATAKSERQARDGDRLPALTLRVCKIFISNSETDVVASNETNHVSIRDQYEGDVITAGIALDELDDPYDPKPGEGRTRWALPDRLWKASSGPSATPDRSPASI